MKESDPFLGYLKCDIGLLELSATAAAITGIHFVEAKRDEFRENIIVERCREQLNEYLAGDRTRFHLPLAPRGTTFQQQVWNSLLLIPYGHTTTYGDIARQLGDANAVRAVGNANGRNPVSIVIPCHRVIGSAGQLVGYGGGLWRKEWLLQHEGALLL